MPLLLQDLLFGHAESLLITTVVVFHEVLETLLEVIVFFHKFSERKSQVFQIRCIINFAFLLAWKTIEFTQNL